MPWTDLEEELAEEFGRLGGVPAADFRREGLTLRRGFAKRIRAKRPPGHHTPAYLAWKERRDDAKRTKPRACEICGADITLRKSHFKTCSRKCSKKRWFRNRKRESHGQGEAGEGGGVREGVGADAAGGE